MKDHDMIYKILETNDFYPLSVLFHNSGLEVAISDETPPPTIKMWRCEDADGKLLAAMTIEKKKGLFVLGNLAVDEEMRGKGLGTELLELAERQVRELDAKEFWLVGKVPGFYKQYGWEEVDREAAPEISGCLRCQQFGTTCFPSVMKKNFNPHTISF